MDDRGDHTRGCGNGHTNKVFAVRPARIRGLDIGANVETRQAASPAKQKQEADKGAPLHHVLATDSIHGGGKGLKSPGVSEEAGSDSEGNDIGQRIKLLAKFAGGFGHARDAAIERVKRDGEADGQGGPVEMPRLLHRTLQTLSDGVVAGSDVARGKKRRHDVHASTHRSEER